jgi:S-adenosylmethionine hydrolase
MARARRPVVALLTDFGGADGYAGVLKGVVLSLCPGAEVVDLCHGIAPGDIAGGALVLDEARDHFPGGTVFCAVVDPGVGTDRRALAAAAGGRFFVGPDNGLLAPCLDADPAARARAIDASRLGAREPGRGRPSATFHGRDLFAPAAAALAAGRPLARLGPAAGEVRRVEGFRATRRGGRLEGRVLKVDRFGNLVTSVTAADLDEGFHGIPFATLDIRVAGVLVDEVAESYGLARPGVPFAYMGSGGRVEVGVPGASAAERLRAGPGATVEIERRGGRR